MANLQIVSVGPEEIRLPMRTFQPSGFTIPACVKGQKFTSLLIADYKDERVIEQTAHTKDAIRIPIDIPAKVIVDDYFGTERLHDRGCFSIPEGQEPTDAQLGEARNARKKWLSAKVQAGDNEYAKTRRVDLIPDYCKRAAAELGVKRPEWAFVAPELHRECPACGETVKPNVAVCKSCGAILDRDKAAKFGLVPGEEPKRGPGRPRKAQEETHDEPEKVGIGGI